MFVNREKARDYIKMFILSYKRNRESDKSFSLKPHVENKNKYQDDLP